jgi:hypothetical protein
VVEKGRRRRRRRRSSREAKDAAAHWEEWVVVPQRVGELGVLLDQPDVLLVVADDPVDGGLLEHPHDRPRRLLDRGDIGRAHVIVAVAVAGLLVNCGAREAAPLALLGDAVVEVVQLLERVQIARQRLLRHSTVSALTCARVVVV